MLKAILLWLLRLLYGFKTENESVLRTAGPVLLLANHVSWWDWLFLGVCLENDWRFVTSSLTAELSWVHRAIMVNRRTFPIDMNSPYAVKHIAAYLQHGGRLVMFPEGRISTTGSLMKLFEGTGFLVGKTRAQVITAYLRGANRLPLSDSPNRKQWFPRVSVHFSQLLTPPKSHEAHPAEARSAVTDWLWDQMIRQQFETQMKHDPATLPLAIIERARKMPRYVIVQDATLKELTYGQLLTGAALLAGHWRRRWQKPRPRVGVLLPNVNGFPVVLLSLWMACRVPAILNYTLGPSSLLACARLAELKQVITSRRFVDRAGLDLQPFKDSGIELVYLEEVRAGLAPLEKLRGLLQARFRPGELAGRAQGDDPALILFTSGSEAEPKGVELTHRNILANVRQMLSVIDLMDTDRFFNALPLFHTFGLTIGLILPLIQGTFALLYLSPLHYRIVPAAFYNFNCTILFGTNTFLAGYARKAHPFDFHSLRYVFAGAEKLRESTLATWMQKFGVRILEGYGATECSPCLSVNVPMHSRPGSAGRFLPGIEYRLEPVEGLTEPPPPQNQPQPTSPAPQPSASHSALRTPHSALEYHLEPVEGLTEPPVSQNQVPTASITPQESPSHSALRTPHSALKAGRLFVRGPNIMRGYLKTEASASLSPSRPPSSVICPSPSASGWYDTGDMARVDADGFVFILDRLKRFAKVSGEMISLTSVEEALLAAFPQPGHHFAIAVVALPDQARGEKLIAVTNEPKVTLAQVREAVRAHGLGALAAPREVKVLADLPRLGSGKINHRELQRILAQESAQR